MIKMLLYFRLLIIKNLYQKIMINSIECNPDYGPVFGFEGDLYISDKFLSEENIEVLYSDYTYHDKKHEILNGKKNLTLDELEVYLIN